MATGWGAPQPIPRRPVRATDALRPLQLEGVRDTGVKVGDGSYATVKELEFRGLTCVGKKIHALLYELASQQERVEILERFVCECELLSRLHHPCIVQFLGVYFEQGSQLPVMVMEYLHTTLADCLERYGVLPIEIIYGIFRDVALGLRYLHENSPPVIHRDLSANNVLLATDMSAKISDLGVAKILNLSPAQITQRISTQMPGTPCYMPPEALVSKPSYTSKIDNYSYGVLMIHVLCGRWPFPGDLFSPDPQNPGSLLPVTEFNRRMEYLQEIGLDHPLMGLIRRCLSNAAASRPEVAEILRQIEVVASQLPPSFENKIEMIKQVQSRKESEVRRNEDELRVEEIESLRRQIEVQRGENAFQRRQLEVLRGDNASQKRQIEIQRGEIQSKTREVESQRTQILLSAERSLRRFNGQWKGYYIQYNAKHEMVCTLTFDQEGSIRGHGTDDLSQYKISGRVQPNGSFKFDKKYRGRQTHTVVYTGAVEWEPSGQPALRGQWSIPPVMMNGDGFLLAPAVD